MATLSVRFNSDYDRAIEILNDGNFSFSPEVNKEWQALEFYVFDADDADDNEKYINEELIQNNFQDFYFEYED